MATAIKLINILGLTVYLLGFLANLGNLISVMLGCVGVVWAIIRCLKGHEDYLIKRIERKERERDFNKNKHDNQH